MRILFSSSDLPLIVKHVAVTFESSAVVGGLAGVRGVARVNGERGVEEFASPSFSFLCLSLKPIQGHKSNKIRHSINCHWGYILFS